MKSPKTTSAAASAPIGITSASAAWRHGPERSDAIAAVSDLADHALDQIVHLLEHHVGLLVRGPGGDDGGAGVVLQRTLEDDEVPFIICAFTVSAFLRALSATAPP